jgi:hypothetical protein
VLIALSSFSTRFLLRSFQKGAITILQIFEKGLKNLAAITP